MRIVTRLVAPGEFQAKFYAIDGSLATIESTMGEWLHKAVDLDLSCKDDYYISAIVRGIKGYVNEFEWKENMSKIYRLNPDMITRDMRLIIDFASQYCGTINVDDNDLMTFQSFRNMKNQWSYKVCSLSEFAWYKHFEEIENGPTKERIVVHNGILSGNAAKYLDVKNLGATILLKDKYRPYMDVTRDGIRGIPLEVASEFAIIQKNIIRQKYDYAHYSIAFDHKNDFDQAMEVYFKLLEDRKDLAEQLLFKTSEGLLTREKLEQKLLEQDKVGYQSNCAMQKNIGMIELYDFLCIALLRKIFTLQVEIGKWNSKIFITNKKSESQENSATFLPVSLFLPAADKKCTFLTNKNAERRYVCNENHRLSQFIIRNGAKMKERVPGIFQELLHTLAEADGAELIPQVNDLLKHLKKYPGGLFEVQDSLYLTEKDLC